MPLWESGGESIPNYVFCAHAHFTAPRRLQTTISMKDYVFSSKPKANPEAVVKGPHYRFTILTDRLLRYEWSHDGKFEDRASTFAINRDLPVPKFRTIDTEHELEIITDHLHLSYDKKKFSPGGLSASFNYKITLWGAPWRYGHVDGNLGGTARTLDEVDGRCDMSTGVLSNAGHATIDDSTSMLFDGEGFVTGRRPGDRIDGYLFAYGHDYKACIKDYYRISGHQPALPRWALGNWWSRYYAYTQVEYIGLMDEFRKRDVPLSVAVVDMDWHLVNDDRVPHAGWGGYTWDDKLFPDPGSFGREMHSRNLKITLNDHPHAGVHHHEESYEEMAKAIGHDTRHKGPMLFDPTNPKFMGAFFNVLHRNIERVACDFWWIDWQQGEFSKVPGIDPLWVLNHFHFLDNGRDGRRPLIFSRYAGPGSHRYPVGFSGDTIVTWASLEFQPEFTATASNIGYGWWSHDIGGHMGGHRDDELVTRWIQFGIFSPIFRLHSSNSRWGSKEPWKYRAEYEGVIEHYMRFRHRLIPFLHTRNVMASTQGEPLVQPMYWAFPSRDEAYSHRNQYMFGFELMICPIVRPRSTKTNLASVEAWLPPLQRHVDIFTGTVYDGDRELTLYRPLNEYPVLAHESSIIPLDGSPAPPNGGFNPTSFEVLVVIGRNGQASILEDPSDDSDASAKESTSTNERGSLIQYHQESGTLVAHVTGRTWSFRFLAVTAIPSDLKVSINDTPTSDFTTSIHTYPETPSLLISLPLLTEGKATITITLGPNPQLSIIDHKKRLEETILAYQTEFHIKDQIWNVVEDDKSPLGLRIGKLLSLGLDEEVVGPVLELLCADSRTEERRMEEAANSRELVHRQAGSVGESGYLTEGV